MKLIETIISLKLQLKNISLELLNATDFSKDIQVDSHTNLTESICKFHEDLSHEQHVLSESQTSSDKELEFLGSLQDVTLPGMPEFELPKAGWATESPPCAHFAPPTESLKPTPIPTKPKGKAGRKADPNKASMAKAVMGKISDGRGVSIEELKYVPSHERIKPKFMVFRKQTHKPKSWSELYVLFWSNMPKADLKAICDWSLTQKVPIVVKGHRKGPDWRSVAEYSVKVSGSRTNLFNRMLKSSHLISAPLPTVNVHSLTIDSGCTTTGPYNKLMTIEGGIAKWDGLKYKNKLYPGDVYHSYHDLLREIKAEVGAFHWSQIFKNPSPIAKGGTPYFDETLGLITGQFIKHDERSYSSISMEIPEMRMRLDYLSKFFRLPLIEIETK